MLPQLFYYNLPKAGTLMLATQTSAMFTVCQVDRDAIVRNSFLLLLIKDKLENKPVDNVKDVCKQSAHHCKGTECVISYTVLSEQQQASFCKTEPTPPPQHWQRRLSRRVLTCILPTTPFDPSWAHNLLCPPEVAIEFELHPVPYT